MAAEGVREEKRNRLTLRDWLESMVIVPRSSNSSGVRYVEVTVGCESHLSLRAFVDQTAG